VCTIFGAHLVKCLKIVAFMVRISRFSVEVAGVEPASGNKTQ
jgi:hypothetical protein